MSRLAVATFICSLPFGFPASGDILDLNNWSLVQDPPDPGLSFSIDSATQVTLSAADQPISNARDMGFKSISGSSPATSSGGYAFDSANSFSVGIDFSLTLASASGGLALGFGIGEDANGSNSAGVVLLTNDGIPAPFAAAARINDANQLPKPLLVPGLLSGRFLANYDAVTGDVQLGVSTNGDDIAEGTATFGGIQNSWAGGQLLPSFFVRSDDTLGTAWTSGTADAVFSNFRVISGTPMSLAAVPEPSAKAIMLLGMVCLYGLNRRRTQV